MGHLGELDLYIAFTFLIGLVIGLLIGKYKERKRAEQAKLDEAFNIAITNTIEQPLDYVVDDISE